MTNPFRTVPSTEAQRCKYLITTGMCHSGLYSANAIFHEVLDFILPMTVGLSMTHVISLAETQRHAVRPGLPIQCDLCWVIPRFNCFDLRPRQHNKGYMDVDGRSQIKVHTDERTQVHSVQSSMAVTHPSTNRTRRYLTSVTIHPASTGRHCGPKSQGSTFGMLD